jgi:DNA-binding transcriptional LysR family regulator
VEDVISTSPTFDPTTSERTFRIVASDYITGVLVAPLVVRLVDTAPRVRIEILLPHDSVLKQLEDGDIDLLITPEHWVSPDLPAELLYEEQHVVAGWSENPLVHKPISEKDLFAAGHVGVSIGNQRTTSFGDKQLESLGKTRRVEIVAPSFAMVPWLLQGTQRLAIMHELLAAAMSHHLPIAYTPLPFAMPPLREMLQYHFARAQDEGLRWFRSELQTLAARIVRNRE